MKAKEIEVAIEGIGIKKKNIAGRVFLKFKKLKSLESPSTDP
tara:strand:- start:935 stop:1060 length:126 start_codon:yes stop_codon:yes gene_type:complete